MSDASDARTQGNPFDAESDTWARDMVHGLPPIAEDDMRALLESAAEGAAHTEYRRLRHARLAREAGQRGLALDEKPRGFWHVHDYPYGTVYRIIDQRGRTVAPAERPGYGAWSFALDDVEDWLVASA